MIGRLVVGRYRIVERLGRGGVGDVYLATDENTGRNVALKLLLPELCRDREALQRFEREAKAAAALVHPNIVQVVDFRRDAPDGPFLVMEHMDGETLESAIARTGALAEERVVKIAIQILGGLETAHRIPMVHRDVKPSNVFLTRDATGEVAKLIDFGIAKIDAENITATGVVLGTPAYMSPEQVVGSPVTARTDVYGVAVTMYYALAKTDPFGGGSIAALFNAIALGNMTPLTQHRPDVDPALLAIITQAMSPDPEKRPQSAAAFRTDLEAWLAMPRDSVTEVTKALVDPFGREGDSRPTVVAVIAPLPSTTVVDAPETLASAGVVHPRAKFDPRAPKLILPRPNPADPDNGTLRLDRSELALRAAPPIDASVPLGRSGGYPSAGHASVGPQPHGRAASAPMPAHAPVRGSASMQSAPPPAGAHALPKTMPRRDALASTGAHGAHASLDSPARGGGGRIAALVFVALVVVASVVLAARLYARREARPNLTPGSAELASATTAPPTASSNATGNAPLPPPPATGVVDEPAPPVTGTSGYNDAGKKPAPPPRHR